MQTNRADFHLHLAMHQPMSTNISVSRLLTGFFLGFSPDYSDHDSYTHFYAKLGFCFPCFAKNHSGAFICTCGPMRSLWAALIRERVMEMLHKVEKDGRMCNSP